MTDINNIGEIAKKAEEWAKSEEGQKAIAESMERAKETIDYLYKVRRVTQDQLDYPLGIRPS